MGVCIEKMYTAVSYSIFTIRHHQPSLIFTSKADLPPYGTRPLG